MELWAVGHSEDFAFTRSEVQLRGDSGRVDC